jgi:hypothetical protein
VLQEQYGLAGPIVTDCGAIPALGEPAITRPSLSALNDINDTSDRSCY